MALCHVQRVMRRRSGAALLAVCVLVAASTQASSSTSFVMPQLPGVASYSTSALRGDHRNAQGPNVQRQPSETIFEGLWFSKSAVVGMALGLALLTVALPQPASAGMLSDFGSVSYDDELRKVPTKTAKQATSRASVLEDAAKQAQQRAAEKEKAYEQTIKAEELIIRLNKEKEEALKAKEAELKMVQARREQEMMAIQSGKRTEPTVATPAPAPPRTEPAVAPPAPAAPRTEPTVAPPAPAPAPKPEPQPVIDVSKKQALPNEQDAREKAEIEDAKAKDAVRAKIIEGLEKRKAEARKAAEEAEAIAKRLEKLAQEAREAAELAKTLV